MNNISNETFGEKKHVLRNVGSLPHGMQTQVISKFEISVHFFHTKVILFNTR